MLEDNLCWKTTSLERTYETLFCHTFMRQFFAWTACSTGGGLRWSSLAPNTLEGLKRRMIWSYFPWLIVVLYVYEAMYCIFHLIYLFSLAVVWWKYFWIERILFYCKILQIWTAERFPWLDLSSGWQLYSVPRLNFLAGKYRANSHPLVAFCWSGGRDGFKRVESRYYGGTQIME